MDSGFEERFELWYIGKVGGGEKSVVLKVPSVPKFPDLTESGTRREAGGALGRCRSNSRVKEGGRPESDSDASCQRLHVVMTIAVL